MRARSYKPRKVNVVTLGCAKNIFDSEVMMAQLRANDFEVEHEAKQDDSEERVLIDRHEDGLWVGRSQYDSPDVDNEVRIAHDGHLRVGDFVTAKITGASSFDLNATLLD